MAVINVNKPLVANLAGEGAGDAAEDEHDEELEEGEGGAGQQEDVVLVVVVAVPELVVVAGLLQHPPRQEVGVEHQHRHGLHQPQPRQHRVVLQEEEGGASDGSIIASMVNQNVCVTVCKL